MTVLYGFHKLAEIGDDSQNFDSSTIPVLDQVHQSATLTVTHLNVEHIFSAPGRGVSKVSHYRSQLLQINLLTRLCD